MSVKSAYQAVMREIQQRDGEADSQGIGAPPCSLSDKLSDWATYTRRRASDLDTMAADERRPEDIKRLKTKAGVFRSLAREIEIILKENQSDSDA